MPPRTCQATARSGKPCKASPLKDKDHCLAHTDQETRDSTGFGGVQPGAGRPPAPRAVDVLRERLEAGIDEVLNPLWEALAAEAPVVVGQGASAFVEMHPDHRTRITAIKELLDRGYGKPKQSTEISGPDGGAILLVPPADATSKSQRAAELLKDLGQVDEPAR